MTDDSFLWEITIEPDQSCVKPRLKVRDAYGPTDEQINVIVMQFERLRSKLTERGFKVAPVK